jgi:hypothetical protein
VSESADRSVQITTPIRISGPVGESNNSSIASNLWKRREIARMAM